MEAKEQSSTLLVCQECDALQNVPKLNPGDAAVCICCRNRLFKVPVGGVDKLLALVIASIILFIVANIYPVLTLDIVGIERETTLTGSSLIFIDLGRPGLAAAVWFPCVFIPGVIIFGLLYILLSIRFRLGWRYSRQLLAWVSRLLPWGMMDVFLLGVLVSLLKLVEIANVLIDTGFYAFIVLIFVNAAAMSSFEPYVLWKLLDQHTNKQRDKQHKACYE